MKDNDKSKMVKNCLRTIHHVQKVLSGVNVSNYSTSSQFITVMHACSITFATKILWKEEHERGPVWMLIAKISWAETSMIGKKNRNYCFRTSKQRWNSSNKLKTDSQSYPQQRPTRVKFACAARIAPCVKWSISGCEQAASLYVLICWELKVLVAAAKVTFFLCVLYRKKYTVFF